MLVQALFISIIPVPMAKAAEAATDINIVSISTLNEIERLNDEIIELRMKKASLDEEDYAQRTEIENQIVAKKEKMAALGAEKVEREFLEELIEAAMDTANIEAGISPAALTNPPDQIAQIAAQFEGMYEISGVGIEYYGTEQYHLIFTSIDCDRHLHQVTTVNAYDSFEANSNVAANFVNEAINIYGQKIFGKVLSSIHPFLQWAPWEVFCESKPSASQISSNGNALVVTLNTISTQKFVFVRGSSAENWHNCLSTNKVSCAVSATVAVNVNGEAKNRSKDYGAVWVFGDWDRAIVDAKAAYESNDVVRNCICEISVHSNSKNADVITQQIHAPKYVADMV